MRVDDPRSKEVPSSWQPLGSVAFDVLRHVRVVKAAPSPSRSKPRNLAAFTARAKELSAHNAL